MFQHATLRTMWIKHPGPGKAIDQIFILIHFWLNKRKAKTEWHFFEYEHVAQTFCCTQGFSFHMKAWARECLTDTPELEAHSATDGGELRFTRSSWHQLLWSQCYWMIMELWSYASCFLHLSDSVIHQKHLSYYKLKGHFHDLGGATGWRISFRLPRKLNQVQFDSPPCFAGHSASFIPIPGADLISSNSPIMSG